ncbi:hypothetical protein TWF481_006236 [Arthrobotrys musiformis]|uniref:Uncharacterized protein n=1 Tax=Arthrobotrys musiformis TaxID=47236 RepID=A0AAV9WGN8_9PEZI
MTAGVFIAIVFGLAIVTAAGYIFTGRLLKAGGQKATGAFCRVNSELAPTFKAE